MHILTLSDHAADQAHKAGKLREANYQRACSRYNALMSERVQKAASLGARRRDAWKQRRYLSWLVYWLPCMLHAMSASPAHPQPQEASRDEIVWNKGSEGEQRVVDHLSRLLDDCWTLIGGIRNAKGELDQLLVGPAGLVAIEVKFVNGRVSCQGDRWWRDKYDRYGNLVERGLPIADKRGRGPSEQVNAVADLLERQVGKRVHMPRIFRAVILSHEKSELGDVQSASVDLVTTLSKLTLADIPHVSILDPDQIGRIVDGIRREHQLFETPRSRNRTATASHG